MKIGDLIRTSGEISKNPVVAYEGDAYPVGALPVGTVVHNIEPTPGVGGHWCKAAGSSATLVRKIDNRCIIKLPSNNELSLDQNCMVTVGQVSHASHQDEKLKHAVDIRDLGYRPRSGLWQRKGPRFGRKIRSPKPLWVVTGEKKQEAKRIPYTYANWDLTE
jgi:large subunit ribosomal protein L2